MIKNLRFFLIKYFSIGADKTTSRNDLKKIRLLNIFCNTWHLFTIFSFIEDAYKNTLMIYSYIIMFIAVGSVQILLYYKKLRFAGIAFVFNLFCTCLFFSNYIYKGELLEYYFLLPPAISLIFINNRKVNVAILTICLLGLFIPNLYLKHYPISVLNNMNPPFLFFSLFIVVSYFKNLNIRNEKILEAKTRELEDLDTFKSQFFTNISHEIRTPLTLINGYITDLNLVADTSKIENIKKQIVKITNMVDNVLDLAKMQSSNFNLKIKSTNISNLIRKQFMNFEPLFNQKNIKFTIPNDTADYFSLIDVVFFEKAINNLIINTLKYTEKGNVSIDTYTKKEQLIIKITDTGIGISHENVERVFNRFYQINNDINKAGGSGIGLAFCKEIIELHHGKINLKSNLGKGSEFTISIPLEKRVPVTHKKENLTKISQKEHNEISKNIGLNNFLIIDDNYDMRKYLKSILKNKHCFEASNGLEALDIITKNNIDFIITDYMMPKLNGYELVIKLNENNNNIPIIMLTAKTGIETKLEVLKLGIDDYITKPFNKNELLTRINNCIKNNIHKTSFNAEHNILIDNHEKDNFIQELKTYIYINSNNPDLNQDTIVIKFNISKSSFYRKIKSKTGLSPNNFINEIRLQKARSILEKNPTILLKQLALEVGFNHTYHFSKLYRERFGINP